MINKYKNKQKHHKFQKRKLLAIPLVLCLAFTMAFGINLSTAFGAGYVTDTLTVKIGYWGMEDDTYVTKGTYSWGQLAGGMPIRKQAYSFYQENKYGYNAIIDSAKGFYISDLLTFAGIERSGVKSISFYTKDQSVGYFTSFSYGALFNSTRYYFHDLSGNLKPKFEEEPDVEEPTEPTAPTDTTEPETTTKPTTETTKPTTEAPSAEGANLVDKVKNYAFVDVAYAANKKCKLISVSDVNAWKHKTAVQPMLALEDHWESYETTSENQPKNTAPNYSSMSTGNRFRLLFGQSSPKESKTSQTAKYVHTVLVTYEGVPEVVEDLKDINGDLGQHKISFKVSSGDTGMVQALIDQMGWSSSDEEVLTVDKVKMTKSSQYDDVVDVQLTYTIKKKGNASIKGTFAGIEIGGSAISTGGNSSGDGGDGSGDGEAKAGDKNKGTSDSKEGDGKKKGKSEEGENQSSQVYELDENVAKMLTQTSSDVAQTDKEVLKVKEEENHTGPFTAAGAACICIGGVIGERIRFRRKL